MTCCGACWVYRVHIWQVITVSNLVFCFTTLHWSAIQCNMRCVIFESHLYVHFIKGDNNLSCWQYTAQIYINSFTKTPIIYLRSQEKIKINGLTWFVYIHPSSICLYFVRILVVHLLCLGPKSMSLHVNLWELNTKSYTNGSFYIDFHWPGF